MGDSVDSTGSLQSTVADCSLVPVERSGTDPSGRSGPSPRGKARRSIIDMPPEVVLIIFQSFLPSVDHKSLRRAGTCRSYMMDLCTLRLVSTSWRDLLDTTASFWVVISSTFPWSVNDTNITRSGNAPLIVHFDTDSPLCLSHADNWDRQALERFLQLLGHTRDRWKVVWLEKYSPDIVPWYLSSAASGIETVRLSASYVSGPLFDLLDEETQSLDGETQNLHLLGGETQNLQHLDLHDVSIPWDRPSFRRLKSLKLCGYVGEEITTDLLVEVLANNPGLEDLKIFHLEIKPTDTPYSPAIRLLQLHSIELKSLRFLDHLLRHIEAPHCQEISIEGIRNPEARYPFTLAESLRTFEPLLLELHQKNASTKFYAARGLMYWRSFDNTDGPPRVNITVRSDSFLSSLRWVERVLQNTDPEGLEVTIDLDRGEPVGGFKSTLVVSTLRRLRCVTDIRTSTRASGREIIDFLCGPSAPSSQNAVPLFPSLRSLSFGYGEVTAEDILHIARTRSAQSTHTTFKIHDLGISPSEPPFIWLIPSTGFSFATIAEIRSIDGVTLEMHTRSYTLREGMLAAVWDEEMGEPTWG